MAKEKIRDVVVEDFSIIDGKLYALIEGKNIQIYRLVDRAVQRIDHKDLPATPVNAKLAVIDWVSHLVYNLQIVGESIPVEKPTDALIAQLKQKILNERDKRSPEIKMVITTARHGEHYERIGYAEECATQYGFVYLDDDASLVVCDMETLCDLMSVMGFRGVGEPR